MSAPADHRRAGRRDRLGRVRLHRRQLRQPGHGRPHRRLGRGGARAPRSSTAASAASSTRRSPADGAAVITADHGNIEEMRDAEGEPQTKHTTSPGAVRARRRGDRAAGAARRHPRRRRADALRADRHAARPEGMTGRRACSARSAERRLGLLYSAPWNAPSHRARCSSPSRSSPRSCSSSAGRAWAARSAARSTAYRSRRGIGAALFRLTIVLAVLFVVFSSSASQPAARQPSLPGSVGPAAVLESAPRLNVRMAIRLRAEVAE